MTKEEKKSLLVFYCVILCIVAKVVYNFYISEAIVLTQYISGYVGTLLASVFVIICLAIFTCLMLIMIFYLYCVWKDDFTD